MTPMGSRSPQVSLHRLPAGNSNLDSNTNEASVNSIRPASGASVSSTQSAPMPRQHRFIPSFINLDYVRRLPLFGNAHESARDSVANSDRISAASTTAINELARPASDASFLIEMEAHPEMSQDALKDMLLHSAIANSLYFDWEKEMLEVERTLRSDQEITETTWRHFELSDDVKQTLNLETLDDGRLYHRSSHLVALVLCNSDAEKTVIAFGGTSSGPYKGHLIQRLLGNPLITLRQWQRNLHATGLHFSYSPVPDSYRKAAELTEAVMRQASGVSVTGHSKGAAEAEYAALVHGPVRAYCFGTPPLSRRLLKTIPAERRHMAQDHIHHYFVKHDVIPALRKLARPVLDVSHVGTAIWLPAPGHVVKGWLYPLWAHDRFRDCVADYAKQRLTPAAAAGRIDRETPSPSGS